MFAQTQQLAAAYNKVGNADGFFLDLSNRALSDITLMGCSSINAASTTRYGLNVYHGSNSFSPSNVRIYANDFYGNTAAISSTTGLTIV